MRSGDKTYTTRFFMMDEPEAVKACRKGRGGVARRGPRVLVCDGFLREARSARTRWWPTPTSAAPLTHTCSP